VTLERIRQPFAVVTQGRSRTRESCMYGSVSSAQKLLIDGVRIVMQVLVDEFGPAMPTLFPCQKQNKCQN
jgi:hypothetical protein